MQNLICFIREHSLIKLKKENRKNNGRENNQEIIKQKTKNTAKFNKNDQKMTRNTLSESETKVNKKPLKPKKTTKTETTTTRYALKNEKLIILYI